MKLKIAQIAPLIESVPPAMYGGTERIVSYLTEALVSMGHEVFLFASGDSVTKASLIPICPYALRKNNCKDTTAMHVLQVQEVIENAHKFDIIHFHTDYLHFPVSKLLKLNTITTLHGRLDMPELESIYSKFINTPVVSISNAQRLPLPMAKWIGTVYHGLPIENFSKGVGGDYVLFIGRISFEKRPDRAIEIAKRGNVKIKIAAKVDQVDENYYEEKIKPLINQPYVEFIGEVNEDTKIKLLQNAKALLFPIDWPEPFGIVMIEALACGTPVIAYNNGSVPEIIIHGKTGFIVNSIEEAVNALHNIKLISRNTCREEFENRFSVLRMADEYVKIYRKMIKENINNLVKPFLEEKISAFHH